MLTTNDVHWCAAECNRQQTGPLEVAYMCDALVWARNNMSGVVTTRHLLELGQYIEPYKNANGFRRTPVSIGTWVLPVYEFGPVLDKVFNNRDLSAEEVYQEFESLHPFIDGNGRVGALLYNYCLGWPNPLLTPPPYKP